MPTRRSTTMAILGVLALAGTASAQPDLTGLWTVVSRFGSGGEYTAPIAITQTGSTLTTPQGASGTIDLETGEFELVFPTSCPSSMEGRLHPDGYIFGSVSVPAPGTICQVMSGFFIGTRTLCGNGALDAGEQCDAPSTCCIACRYATAGAACASDDNTCTSDVCDAAGTCTHPPLPADTSCPDDGAGCTADRCDGAGTCTHPVLPAGSTCAPGGPCRATCDGIGSACPLASAGTYDPTCGACEACDGSGACAPGPLTGCRQTTAPRASTVKLQRFADHTRDRFVWKWSKGEATTLADFGAVETDGLAVCAWNAADETVAAAGLGASTRWKRSPSRLVYRDESGSQGPLSAITLTPGAAGKSRIIVQGRGDFGMPLGPLAPPLVVQLQGANACWEATFGAPTRNDTGLLQAKSD